MGLHREIAAASLINLRDKLPNSHHHRLEPLCSGDRVLAHRNCISSAEFMKSLWAILYGELGNRDGGALDCYERMFDKLEFLNI